MYQLVHYSYHNVPLGELVGTLWKIIYQLIHYGNIIAFQNQSYLQIRLEKCLISHQYNVTKGILNNNFSPENDVDAEITGGDVPINSIKRTRRKMVTAYVRSRREKN